MITYKVIQTQIATKLGAGAYSVIAKESGVVVAGPFATKNKALAEANLRASAMPGNRVES